MPSPNNKEDDINTVKEHIGTLYADILKWKIKYFQLANLPYTEISETVQSILLLDPTIIIDLLSYYFQKLKYSAAIYSCIDDNLTMLDPNAMELDSCFKNKLKSMAKSSSWNSFWSIEGNTESLDAMIYKQIDNTDTFFILINPIQSQNDELQIHHKYNIGRDIHFTLSTVMTTYFISVDCFTLQILFSTLNIQFEYGFSIPCTLTLLDLCYDDDEKREIQRINGSMMKSPQYTMQYTMHSYNPKRGLMCWVVYSVRVRSFHNPVLSIRDNTKEEHDQIIRDALEIYSLKETICDSMIVCNMANEVLFVHMNDAIYDKEGTNSKCLDDYITFEGEKATIKQTGIQCSVQRIKIRNGSCIILSSNEIQQLSKTESNNYHILSEMIQENLFCKVTNEELFIITRKIMTQSDSLFAIYKYDSLDPPQLVFSNSQLNVFLHFHSIQQKSTLIHCSIAMIGYIIIEQKPCIIYSSKNDLFQYLSSHSTTALLEQQNTKLFCKEIQATVFKSQLLPNLFFLQVAIEHQCPSGLLSAELHFLINQITLPIILLDETTEIHYANPIAVNLFGDIHSLHIDSLIDEESKTILDKMLACPVNRLQTNNLLKIQTKEYLVSLYHTDNKQYILILNIYHDYILAQNNANSSIHILIDENSRMKRILTTLFNGSCLLELQTLRIVQISTNLQSYFKCKENNSMISDFIDEKSMPYLRQLIDEVRNKGHTICEERITMKIEDELREVELFIIPTTLCYHVYSQAILCIKDVTTTVHMRNKEERMQKQIELLNCLHLTMIQIAFSGSCMFDISTLLIMEQSMPSDLLNDNSIFDRDTHSFCDDFKQVLLPYINELGEQRSLQHVYVIVHREKPMHLELNMVVLTDDTLVMMTYRNITHMIEREEKEIQLREEAETANRNKRDFVAYIFHEVRNSLSPISMGIDLMLTGEQSPSDNISMMLPVLRSCCDSLSHTLDDVLSMQKIEEGKYIIEPSIFNVNTALEALISQYGILCSVKKINLLSSYDSFPSSIVGDQVRLSMVIGNFLSNATKFTSEGGRIEVRKEFLIALPSYVTSFIQKPDTEENVILKNFGNVYHRKIQKLHDGYRMLLLSTAVQSKSVFEKAPSWLRIAVADSGIGLTEDDLRSLFQPYQQVRSGELQKGRGTGLGLCLSLYVVSQHNGLVGLLTHPGKGSTFSIILPVTEITEKKEGVLHSPVVQRSEEIKTIAVVDDQSSVLQLTMMCLKRLKYTCTAFTSGIDLIKAIENNAKFDVILLDYEMPVMNGGEVIQRLRNEYHYDGIVVGLTGVYGIWFRFHPG